jgi:peptide/nickel transport system permease protein
VFRTVLNRLVAALVQILLVTMLAWLLFYVIAHVSGATVAQRIAGRSATREQIQQITHHLGLDQPYWKQYLLFMKRVLHGDFGYSYVQQRPESDIVWPAMRATASLVVGAVVIWLAVAVPIGAYGGLKPRSFGDVAGRVVAILGMSIPVFWLAPIVSYLFGFQPTQGKLFGFHVLPAGTTLFPIVGYVDFGDSPVSWAYHLVLPWLTLALGFTAVYIRFVRTLTAEQLEQDYVRTARAKGASTTRVLTRHAGRNVAPSIAVLLGADVATALTGVFFVETVFAIPGIGFTGLSAIENLDYPVVTAVIMLAALVAVAANAVVDIARTALDPRLRGRTHA